jgi:hypothetical protein
VLYLINIQVDLQLSILLFHKDLATIPKRNFEGEQNRIAVNAQLGSMRFVALEGKSE